MQKEEAAGLLATLHLGTGVAETDDQLESARVETSVFYDLLADRVDLVPGTKGSGKTALYRIFVDFLPDILLKQRKVVIAHGVQHRQDTVFLAYRSQFDGLSETDFTDFWCVYLISLAYEQFLRSDRHIELLSNCDEELANFRQKYAAARIPEFDRKKTLLETLGWALEVITRFKARVAFKVPGDIAQLELSFDGEKRPSRKGGHHERAFLTAHIDALTTSLEQLLSKANLSLWLMIDRLDEIFARRSRTEQSALRGLLHTLRYFRSERIRVKVFLRDDILEEIVSPHGFTSLSHVSARKSDTLRWSEEQILAMVVRRIFASKALHRKFIVDDERMEASVAYQKGLLYNVFSDHVHRPHNQSRTLRWIYNRTKDGRGVVTPRDVIKLLTRACQWQRDEFRRDPQGETDRLVLGQALIYGLGELSREKRTEYLQAEFPHKWGDISKLVGGSTEYSEAAMKGVFGRNYVQTIEDLLSLGVLERSTREGKPTYKVPYLYRRGLECTQKFAPA